LSTAANPAAAPLWFPAFAGTLKEPIDGLRVPLASKYPTRADVFHLPSENAGMKRLIRAFFAMLLASIVVPALAQEPQTNLPRVKLSAGMHLIDAQVAQTPGQREVGLMFREQMPQNEGMLFVFEQPSQQCFWMRNTLIPLTAAFVADDGTLVNLEDMKPRTLESHCSAKPVRYVLEMNQGWFARKGIKAGFKLSGATFQSR
jgi:hypothetical protein